MDSYLDMQRTLTSNQSNDQFDQVSVSNASTAGPSKDMKVMVRKWSELDSEMRRATNRMKTLKLEKAELEEKIIDFMNQNDLEGLNTKDALIQYKKRTTKVRVPKKVIHNEIDKLIVDTDTRSKIKQLLDNPPTEVGAEKVVLKRLVF